MTNLTEILKTIPKPFQFLFGVAIVTIIVFSAKYGFQFGSWLKSYF